MVVADDDPMKRAKQFDNIYREKVLVFARKMVAKQQARDLLKQQMENVSYVCQICVEIHRGVGGGGVIPWNGHDGASHFVHYREVSSL